MATDRPSFNMEMKVMDSQTICQNHLQNHLNRIHTALITFHIKISSASRRDKSCNYPTGPVSPRVSLTNVASLALFQENALFQSSSGEEYKKTP